MLQIRDDYFVAKPIPNGFTWTLTSRFGDMLSMAEAQYGQRDRSFTILGIEFVEGVPQIMFPGNADRVIVQLGVPVLADPKLAMCQLGHLCTYLLDPAQGRTTVLEEGIAVKFATDYLLSVFDLLYKPTDQNHITAHKLVESLLHLKNDAAKELRRFHGPWRRITCEHILKMCPALPASTAQQLTNAFRPSGEAV